VRARLRVIDAAGLICVVISLVVHWSWAPTLKEEAPWWVYALNGFALWAYQILDALDGKQARRTGTSSPLGLVFDHGCDSINTCFSALLMCSTLCIGSDYRLIIVWAMGAIVFYLQTMEEYVRVMLFHICLCACVGVFVGIAASCQGPDKEHLCLCVHSQWTRHTVSRVSFTSIL
jgi:hypothetical protein